MSKIERLLAEDKALRDAALQLFKSDLALIREGLRERSVGERIADRLSDATMDMLDDAVDYAEANKGTVAALVTAIVLWFARGPILDALAGLFSSKSDENGEGDTEPDEPGDRSNED